MSPKLASTTSSDADKSREQLLAEFRRANRALKALSECKDAMIQAGDEAVLLNDICRIIVDVGGYRMAWIGYIENDEVKTVRPVARAGYDEGYVDNLKIALEDPVSGNGPTGISIKTGKPFGSRNVRSDKEMRPWRTEALKRGYHSTLNLPLIYEKQVIGTLAIYSGEVEVFDEEEQGLLFGLAQTLAYGITAMRDRVRRIRAEEVLKRANEELERRIDERTAKLRESEENFKVLAETSAAAIFVYQGKRIISVNQTAERITGYSKGELLTMDFLDLVHPDFKELVLERSQARQRGEPYPPQYEFKLITKCGDVRWIETTAGRILYRGMPAGVATLFDITERKQAGNKLEEAKAQAELYLDLMGHDINNMNQSAIGFLELALGTLEADGKIGLDGKLLIEKPLQAIYSSSKLIENVSKLQRLMTGGIKTWPVDLHDLFDELKDLDFHAGDKDVTINFMQIPHYVVEGNELLRDMFFNLISNAVKHSRTDKPVTVDIRVERVDEEGRAFYRCAIEDDGHGIPDNLKVKLFHRLQRGKTKAQGKGLGLYLVRTLVEGYHGRVWVEDRVAGDHTKGARFVVMLPALDSTDIRIQ